MRLHTRTGSSASAFLGSRRTSLRDEQGVTLVIVLLMVCALTLTTVSLSSLVLSNAKAFGRDRQQVRAFNTAEAGLNYGISRLTTFDPTGALPVNSTLGSSGAPQLYTLDGHTGNGGWWAVKISPTVWEVHARAVSPNGTLSREVAVNTTANTQVTNIGASAAWGYGLFVASPTGCATIVGNANVTMPIWIKSDICFQGTSGIAEPNPTGTKKVKVYVGGKVTTGGGAKIGTASRKIISATIVGGCNGGTAAICSNSSFSNVYADTYSSAPSALTKPPLYLQETYRLADWTRPTCSVGSFTFDNNTSMDGSASGFPLFGSSYACTVKNASGTQVGKLEWDGGSRVLKVDGIVFLDGNLSIGGGSQASYQGTGAIYVNGSVSTQGNSALCGPGAILNGSSCDGLWDSTRGALGIVATGGWSMSGTAEFNVLAYVVGTYDDGGSAKVTGPIIADVAKIHGTADTTDDPNPPPGMPGSAGYTSTTTWSVVRGTWREIASRG